MVPRVAAVGSLNNRGARADDPTAVVVEKRAAAGKGDIVVAIVDNQFTLKRLDLENGRFILRPENKGYPVIRPEGTLEIFGVMVGLVRKL